MASNPSAASIPASRNQSPVNARTRRGGAASPSADCSNRPYSRVRQRLGIARESIEQACGASKTRLAELSLQQQLERFATVVSHRVNTLLAGGRRRSATDCCPLEARTSEFHESERPQHAAAPGAAASRWPFSISSRHASSCGSSATTTRGTSDRERRLRSPSPGSRRRRRESPARRPRQASSRILRVSQGRSTAPPGKLTLT